jgi:DNA-binding NarL/FixJ family response regulator
MANRTVYILEDEAVIRLILTRYLRKNGYTVVGQNDNAERALPEVVETQPDVILVDIYLANNTDGIEMVNQLKKPHPVTVFLTGNSDEATRERAMKLDPAGYLVKPIDMGELLNLLDEAQIQK